MPNNLRRTSLTFPFLFSGLNNDIKYSYAELKIRIKPIAPMRNGTKGSTMANSMVAFDVFEMK